MRLGVPSGKPTADYIAEVAAALFYRDGIHAVGVDRIADAAGLTKRTMYRYYRSKDDLIAASLRHAPRVPFPECGPPAERIIGAFTMLEEFLTGSEYRGCPYIIFTAELSNPGHPARRLIERLLTKRREWFRDRAVEAGLAEPDRLAEELDLLFDGAVASGAKRCDVVAAQTAKRMAATIVRSASASRSSRQGVPAPPRRARETSRVA